MNPEDLHIEEQMRLASSLWSLFEQERVSGGKAAMACMHMIASIVAASADDDASLEEGIKIATENLERLIRRAYAMRTKIEHDPQYDEMVRELVDRVLKGRTSH